MTPARWSTEELIRRTDFLRGPEGEGRRWKEWFHFIVAADDVEVLVNLALLWSPEFGLQPRVIVLLHDADGWQGGVEVPPHAQPRRGRVAVDTPQCSFDFEDGRFALRASVSGLDLEAELVPLVPPRHAGSVAFGGGRLTWLSVPHLRATATVRTASRTHRFADAPAYHDHNWGGFDWRGDSAWQWLVAMPERADGFGLVYEQVVDRRSRRPSSTGCMLFHGRDHLRTYVATEVTGTTSRRCFHAARRYPSVMALAVPGRGIPVPDALRVECARHADRVALDARFDRAAEIGIPPDRDGATPTLLSEAFGTGRISGRLGGEEIDSPVRCIHEQIEGGHR